jgi:hypothetical protein
MVVAIALAFCCNPGKAKQRNTVCAKRRQSCAAG